MDQIEAHRVRDSDLRASPTPDLMVSDRRYLLSPIAALRVVEKNLALATSLGFGTENASALIKALEKEAGVEVKGSIARVRTE